MIPKTSIALSLSNVVEASGAHKEIIIITTNNYIVFSSIENIVLYEQEKNSQEVYLDCIIFNLKSRESNLTLWTELANRLFPSNMTGNIYTVLLWW